MNKNDLLWVIYFDQKNEHDLFQNVQIDYLTEMLPVIKSQKDDPTLDNQQLALDFLDHLNHSFKEITDIYLSKVEVDDSLRPQIEEIRQRFKTIDQWISLVRTWLHKKQTHEEE